MTELVQVTVTETPIIVSVSTDTPTVTVTDLDTQTVTVIDAAPQVTVNVDQQPTVIVNTGVGSAYDIQTLLLMLQNQLSLELFSGILKEDLVKLRDLWSRVGEGSLLTYSEGDEMMGTYWTQTHEYISSVAADLDVSLNGDLSLATSQFMQRADAIELQVGLYKQDADGNFALHSSQILQNATAINQRVDALEVSIDGDFSHQASLISQQADSITNLVTRIDSVDGTLSSHTSQITQRADEIQLNVTAIETVDGRVTQNASNISLQADLLALSVTRIDSLTGDVDQAKIDISATDGIVSSMIQTVANQDYRIQATETLLKDQWGVEIVEDAGGQKSITGVKLISHTTWLTNTLYTVDETVYYEGSVYQCIVEHTSSSSILPTSVTYWQVLSTGVKSEFIIQADKFKVLTDTGPVPVFSVSGSDIVISGTLTIGSGSTGYNNLTDKPDLSSLTALQNFVDVTYPSDQSDIQNQIDGKIETWFQILDPANYWSAAEKAQHAGDLWWHTTLKRLKRWSGSSWSDEIVDQVALNAYENAATAQDTADGKRRVFVNTPTTPYDVGDLWDRGASLGLWRCKTGRSSSYSYSVSDWQAVIAADTAKVNGVDAAVVQVAASQGKSIFDAAGSLAYLDALESVAQLGETIVSGGYIKTELLKTADIIVANDVLGTMSFTSTGKITFARSDQYLSGSSTTLTINAGINAFYINNAGGISLVANYSNSSIDLNANKDVVFNAGNSSQIKFKFNNTSQAYINQSGILPNSNNNMLLGDTGQAWSAVHATAVYRNGTALDEFDDLYELSQIKPLKRITRDKLTKEILSEEEIKNPKINMAYIDPFSVPKSITNYDDVVQKLKRDNCNLLTAADIEELIQDYDEAGWMFQIDLGLFSDLTSGGLRQLDQEVNELISLMAARITVLEQQVAALHNTKTTQ